MNTANFLTLAAAGAIITTSGSLFALFIKDFLLTRYFDERKEKKTLDNIYKKYKDPILLSTIEVSSRLLEIHRDYPTVFLTRDVMYSTPKLPLSNTTDDEYYRKHKFVSTLYRLCSFFGWLELYRQEITFLNSSDNKQNLKLDKCLGIIRSVFADGHLNDEKDWNKWVDFLIYREEQRAIGERMIVINNGVNNVMGYYTFKKLIHEYIYDEKNDWVAPAFNFILNLKVEKDFRKNRYRLLLNHFCELLETLDQKKAAHKIAEIKKHLQG